MNDTTMPPPTAPRHKTPLRKGFGLSDWNKLLQTATDLAQLQGGPIRRNIPWSEIKQHNTLHDGWVVLRRKVYNVSPYLAYHPGGEAILRKVLGKDITALYDKYHRWVNEHGLIGKLLIGYVDTTTLRPAAQPSGLPALPPTSDGLAMPAPRPKVVAAQAAANSALSGNSSSNQQPVDPESDEEEELWDN